MEHLLLMGQKCEKRAASAQPQPRNAVLGILSTFKADTEITAVDIGEEKSGPSGM